MYSHLSQGFRKFYINSKWEITWFLNENLYNKLQVDVFVLKYWNIDMSFNFKKQIHSSEIY